MLHPTINRTKYCKDAKKMNTHKKWHPHKICRSYRYLNQKICDRSKSNLKISWILAENNFFMTNQIQVKKIDTYVNAWILAPDTGQCPAKYRIMSNESCLTTYKVSRVKVNFFTSYLRLKIQNHSVNTGLSWFFFLWTFWKTIYFYSFFYIRNFYICLLETVSPLKTFYMS